MQCGTSNKRSDDITMQKRSSRVNVDLKHGQAFVCAHIDCMALSQRGGCMVAACLMGCYTHVHAGNKSVSNCWTHTTRTKNKNKKPRQWQEDRVGSAMLMHSSVPSVRHTVGVHVTPEMSTAPDGDTAHVCLDE